MDGTDQRYPQPAKIEKVKATQHDAQLKALLLALKSIKKPINQTWDVKLYTTESDIELENKKSSWAWVTTQIEQNLVKWEKNYWRTSTGKEVQEPWKELHRLLNDFPCEIITGENHEYRKWLIENLKEEK